MFWRARRGAAPARRSSPRRRNRHRARPERRTARRPAADSAREPGSVLSRLASPPRGNQGRPSRVTRKSTSRFSLSRRYPSSNRPSPMSFQPSTAFSRWQATNVSDREPTSSMSRPVPQIPLRLLAQGARHVAVPRPDQEPEVKVAQGCDPAADRIDRDPRLARESAVHELAAGPVRQLPDQQLHLVDLLNAGQVPDVLPNELPEAQRTPAPAESGVPPPGTARDSLRAPRGRRTRLLQWAGANERFAQGREGPGSPSRPRRTGASGTRNSGPSGCRPRAGRCPADCFPSR